MQFLEAKNSEEIVAGPSDRKFGLTMAAVFAVIGGFALYGGSVSGPAWLGLASVFAGLALWRPRSLRLANAGWLRLGLLMYRFVNPVVMAILFFIAIMPIGLTMRLFGKDFLRLKWDRTLPTYWLHRSDPRPPSESMRQQF
jgi:Saxitoxin biosynthesis operon protein SxtJ